MFDKGEEMKMSLNRIFGFSIALVLMGQSAASADFEGPFAPANWTFSGDAASNSLSSTQMQITSLDRTLGQPKFGTETSSSYSISVPYFVAELSFSYSYTTNDVNGSNFDMAQYGVGGAATNLVQVNPNQGYTESGTVSLAGIGGQTFSIIQNALDTKLGSATITITNFSARNRNMNELRLDSAPVATEKAGVISCSPGTYTFLNGGSTEQAANLGALVYTLVIDGKPVSRLGAGSSSSLPAHLFPAFAQTVQGTADMKGATWDVSAMKNFDARCEVYAWQSGVNVQSTSEQISDAVKAAEIAAKSKAWEDQRASATAANFTQQAREMRKRIAARSGN
jgi:hypothetical protein